MEKCLLLNFYMCSENSGANSSDGTSDSRLNVPVPVSGVEEGKKTDTDTDLTLSIYWSQYDRAKYI